jgi:hypothetical protein
MKPGGKKHTKVEFLTLTVPPRDGLKCFVDEDFSFHIDGAYEPGVLITPGEAVELYDWLKIVLTDMSLI